MNRQQRRAAAKLGNARLESARLANARLGNGQGAPSAQQSGAVELVATGMRHHRAGQLQEAEKHYWLALDIEPGQPDALHLLGVLAIQAGRPAAAAELIGKAVQRNASNPAYLANLAVALQQQGKLDDALTSLDQALALKADLSKRSTAAAMFS